ncbi:MAG: ABC transporter substrate-binding protein [candidate division WS1 bacterium]|nr:ABC transporter substrate-binding protein [candidate division WS1 bacterium]
MQFIIGVILALLLLAGAVLMWSPRVMPPPGPRATAPGPPASAFPLSFTDALGREITLARPANRIITLSPNLAETVCAVGAADQLVGVDEYTRYPPAAAAKTKVGGIINPDLEKILALQPDLILVARGLDKQLITRLQELACPVAAFDPQSVEEVLELVEDVGQLSGRQEQARKLVSGLRARLDRVRAAAQAGSHSPRVLLIITWDGLFVGGVGGYAHDLIATAGGLNAVTLMKGISPHQPWPTVTRELVVASDPEVIVFAGGMGVVPGGQTPAETLAVLRKDPAWARLSAVRTGRVVRIEDDVLTIPGPRLFDGLEALQKALGCCPPGGSHAETG